MGTSGAILLPYQRRLFVDRSELLVVEKSRRIGATWALAAKQVELAARPRSAGGTHCIYMSTSQRLARIYVREAARWVEALEVAAQAAGGTLGAEILKDEIRFRSGHTLTAAPSNPESLRGMGGDTVIDEAAFHLDLEEILKAADAVRDWGGSLTVISTHNGESNPFNRLVKEVREGERRGSLHRITIHDALADGLHRRRCDLRGKPYTLASENAWLDGKRKGWGFAEEYEVVPSSGGGVYLRRSLVEAAGNPDLPIARLDLKDGHEGKGKAERARIINDFIEREIRPRLGQLSRERLHYVGGDVGRSAEGDLSVFVLLEVDPRDAFRVARLVVELRGVPWDEQWTILREIGRGCPRLAGGGVDRQGIGSWISEKAASYFGAEVLQRVAISAEWYLSALPKLRTAFEEGAIEHPLDRDLLDDLGLVQVVNGRPALPKTRTRCSRTGRPRHGDYAIALALANENVPLPGPSAFRRVGEDDLADYNDNPRKRAKQKKSRRRRGL